MGNNGLTIEKNQESIRIIRKKKMFKNRFNVVNLFYLESFKNKNVEISNFLFFKYLGLCISILSLTNYYAAASQIMSPLIQNQSMGIQQMEEGAIKKPSADIMEEKSDRGLAREVSSNIGNMSVSGDAMGIGVNHGVIDARREDHYHSSIVQGNVALGDYFETNVYQNIEEPHKKLFEQMTRATLEYLSKNPNLVVDFEVASKDFSEIIGPGISSALYPTTLETYKRLADQSHPIALERYADHLIFSVQVKTDRDLMCTYWSIFCEKVSSNEMCRNAETAYRSALSKYETESSHARLLIGKIEDCTVIANKIDRRYWFRVITTYTPIFIFSITVISILAEMDSTG